LQKHPKRVAALIVAAGKGRRMGSPRAKAFLTLNGIPILVHAIRPFEASNRIQSLYVVLQREDIQLWQNEILSKFPLKKTKPPVAGGSRRQDSVRSGLEAISEDIDTILIHDGVRPFVDETVLDQLLDTMEEALAAVVAVPAKETLKIVSSTGQVRETLARERIWTTQTPQAFDFHTLIQAHHKALQDDVQATDDSTLVERMGIPVIVVRGSYTNIKVTTPEDLIVARALLETRGQIPSGS
jgi:2-C-methyl-D-erythritol 4-phosphate cytidylyltransferase